MASQQEIQKQIFDELRTTHEEFKKAVDIQIAEVRSAGYSKSETDETVNKLEAAITDLRKSYDDITVKLNRPMNIGESHEIETEETRTHKSAFIKYLRRGIGESGRAIMSPEEYRALSDSADKDGGFLIPTAWESGLLVKAYNEAELRPLCNVGTTGRDSVYTPSLKKPVVAWGTTNLAISEQQLSAGGERLEVHDLKALVLIHNNTLDDSDSDIWAELSDAFSMAVAEAEDDAFATGAGNNSPKGIIADSRVLANFKVTGVAGALSDASNNGVDALIGMLQSLKKTYRRNATWAMNSTTEGDVRKLKNSNGDYLWQPPVQAGSPATLLGRPLANPEGMPDVAANAFPIVLGDFRKGYRIRDRKGLVVSRLIERYAEYDQTGFLVKKRLAGQVVMPEAFVCLKVST